MRLLTIPEVFEEADKIDDMQERIEFIRKHQQNGTPIRSFYEVVYQPPKFKVTKIRTKGYDDNPFGTDEFALNNMLKFLKNLKVETDEEAQRRGLEYVFSVVGSKERELLIKTIIHGKNPSRRVSKKLLEKVFENAIV